MKRVALVLILLLAMTASGQAITLAGLRYAVMTMMDQDTSLTPRRWTNTELNFWINRAIGFVSDVALCVEKETTLVLVPSQTDYNMPSDFIKAKGAMIWDTTSGSIDLDRSSVGLLVVEEKDLGKEAGGRVYGPYQVVDLGRSLRKIRFGPTPMADYTIKISYWGRGRDLTADTMTCDVPISFEAAVIEKAASLSWQKLRLADPYINNFWIDMQNLVPRLQTPSQVQPQSKAPVSP